MEFRSQLPWRKAEERSREKDEEKDSFDFIAQWIQVYQATHRLLASFFSCRRTLPRFRIKWSAPVPKPSPSACFVSVFSGLGHLEDDNEVEYHWSSLLGPLRTKSSIATSPSSFFQPFFSIPNLVLYLALARTEDFRIDRSATIEIIANSDSDIFPQFQNQNSSSFHAIFHSLLSWQKVQGFFHPRANGHCFLIVPLNYFYND